MFKKAVNKNYLVLVLLVFFASAGMIQAADLNILPVSGKFGRSQEFNVDIKLNSGGQSINAAQAKIKFNPAVLEVKSVSKEGSVFNFWLEGPEFSNTAGELKFIGGTPNGVSGASLEVLKIQFIAKSIGSSEVSFIDAAITAADGSGNNVLLSSNGASFNVVSAATAPVSSENISVAVPVQITRKPAEATGLPVMPNIAVSLYPDQNRWYNLTAPFLASWELPADISGVVTAFNGNPNFEPSPRSEGLFDSKTFPATWQDGIYYLHVRFQNNRGWGKTAHHKIQIDTQPPLPFEIEVRTGLSSDHPSPLLAFKAGDALSGVDRYMIVIGSEEPLFSADPEYSIPTHPPGKYIISVRALDKADNSLESSVEVEILPIDSPVVLSVTEMVIKGTDDILRVKGTAIPDSAVILTIQDEKKILVFQVEVKVLPTGEWLFQLDEELRSGDYFVIARTKDQRGAISFSTYPKVIKVRDKPVISLFGLNITFKHLVWILLAATVLIGGWFWRKINVHILKTQRTSVFVVRDLKIMLDLIKKELNKMSSMTEKNIPVKNKNIEYSNSIKKIADSLDKIDRYVKQDIEKLD